MNKELAKEYDKQVEFYERRGEIQDDLREIRKKLEEKKRFLEGMRVDLEVLVNKVDVRVDYKYKENRGEEWQEELEVKEKLLIKEVERAIKGLEEEVERTKEDIHLTYIDGRNTSELRYDIEIKEEKDELVKEKQETEGIVMDKKEKEMLVDVIGAIGWQGFDLAIYEDGSWDYENKNRFESNPTARYIDLEDYEYWDSYLGDFINTDEDGYELDEDYEDVYEVADDVRKKAMIDAVDLAINSVVDF